MEKINIETILQKQFKIGSVLNKSHLFSEYPVQISVFLFGLSMVNLETEQWKYFIVKNDQLQEVSKKEWNQIYEKKYEKTS